MIARNQFFCAAGSSTVGEVPAPAEKIHGPQPLASPLRPACNDEGLYLALADHSWRPAGRHTRSIAIRRSM